MTLKLTNSAHSLSLNSPFIFEDGDRSIIKLWDIKYKDYY